MGKTCAIGLISFTSETTIRIVAAATKTARVIVVGVDVVFMFKAVLDFFFFHAYFMGVSQPDDVCTPTRSKLFWIFSFSTPIPWVLANQTWFVHLRLPGDRPLKRKYQSISLCEITTCVATYNI